MATAGGLRRLVYIPDPPLTPNGEPQPQGQQDSGGGLTSAEYSGLVFLLVVVVAAFVIACIFYPICKKAEDLETTGHGGGGGGGDRRRARWQRQHQQRQVSAAVPEVVVDIDKSGQQAEPSLKCTYRAADGWEERTCSVCLAELQDGEAVRMLMPCTHYFHATCPICRAPTVAAKAGRQ